MAHFNLRGLVQESAEQAATRGGAGAGVSDDLLAFRQELGVEWHDRVLQPVGSRSAASGQAEEDVEIDHADIMTVQFGDGFELLISAEDYRHEFLEPTTTNSRGVTTASDGLPTWSVPDRLPASLQTTGASRGWLGDIVRVVVHKVTGRVVDSATNTAAQVTALELSRIFENRALSKWTAGSLADDKAGVLLLGSPDLLQKRSLDGTAFAPTDATKLDNKSPILLFIHGTASSTEGSFLGLWEDNSKLLTRLHGRYQQVCAFEHRTLTVSPVKNAIALVQSLPPGATLHVVTHSRGGLVGEVLCRGQRIDAAGFDEDDRKLLGGRDSTNEEWKELQALTAAMKEKNLKIERFVRVACPALGTTLASGRIDRWLSFLLWALGKAATGASPAFGQAVGLFSTFAKAIIQQRTDPKVLPGLEAMMPGSPLVRMLTREYIAVASDLSVIAGDREGDDWVQKSLMWVPDLFYGGDHDFVINTGSMYGGARRVDAQR